MYTYLVLKIPLIECSVVEGGDASPKISLKGGDMFFKISSNTFKSPWSFGFGASSFIMVGPETFVV